VAGLRTREVGELEPSRVGRVTVPAHVGPPVVPKKVGPPKLWLRTWSAVGKVGVGGVAPAVIVPVIPIPLY
jgi:hypothetical protein